jgi:hypothetical protein
MGFFELQNNRSWRIIIPRKTHLGIMRIGINPPVTDNGHCVRRRSDKTSQSTSTVQTQMNRVINAEKSHRTYLCTICLLLEKMLRVKTDQLKQLRIFRGFMADIDRWMAEEVPAHLKKWTTSPRYLRWLEKLFTPFPNTSSRHHAHFGRKGTLRRAPAVDFCWGDPDFRRKLGFRGLDKAQLKFYN